MGTDEDALTEILSTRSNQQLREILAFYQQVFGQYRKSHGLEVEETICKRFRGDGQAAMPALASVCRNTPRYFAEKLHNAVKVSRLQPMPMNQRCMGPAPFGAAQQ
ncbi:Annexin A9 [Chelonia mydas]|uniref:Annexin A9 n=1 Tax=Chelonia mydas TaxID=8469 RepID=M7BI73_CHEMY|nr:Annexin A9 [Chelonia mydas]